MGKSAKLSEVVDTLSENLYLFGTAIQRGIKTPAQIAATMSERTMPLYSACLNALNDPTTPSPDPVFSDCLQQLGVAIKIEAVKRNIVLPDKGSWPAAYTKAEPYHD